MNFGPSFLHWIRTFYHNISSCFAVNNGYGSDFFTLQRGVRQGLPRSRLLFVLATEPLANRIRINVSIKCLKNRNIVTKLSLFADDIQALREVQIFSKSQRKAYTLEDVKGQQIGRVQHFLNTQLHGLLRCGKITRIEGEINGEPTLTSRPNSTQRFSRNKQAGGGAYIPATIWVEGPQRYKVFVLERIRSTLPECENVEDMPVECLE